MIVKSTECNREMGELSEISAQAFYLIFVRPLKAIQRFFTTCCRKLKNMMKPLKLSTIQIFIIIIMLAFSLCIAFIVLIRASNVPNYQERFIYLSEDDNVCLYRPVEDKIKLVVNIEGGGVRTLDAQCSTGCSNRYTTYAQQITTMDHWNYISHVGWIYTNYFRFNEDSRRVYRDGILTGIIEKVTNVNPTVMDGEDYDCTILGVGTIQHFGQIFPQYKPATIYMTCKKNPKITKIVLAQ